MNLALRVWRQRDARAEGRLVRYQLDDVSAELTLLEALDSLNERLVALGQSPIAFDSDCREGICGACGIVVNGRPHGPLPGTTTCLLPLRAFRDGDTVTLQPFRTGAFAVVRDLVVDRGALDRVVQAGGFVSVRAGSASDANAIPIPPATAARALDAAACIGCGACVAACPNGSAALFVGAKLTHLALLPQGSLERGSRAKALVGAADREGFGGCTLHGECAAVCPKGIDLGVIARMNREYLRALYREPAGGTHGNDESAVALTARRRGEARQSGGRPEADRRHALGEG
jgi:succinate dehydrogenase / fumarate reductase iron-sulfur subunit